ncbi:MAG TPA: hypothetical protein VE999_03695 [Gemmataceae bacterium]|nr:hypothetical protein [Gemmataceae bacterium]
MQPNSNDHGTHGTRTRPPKLPGAYMTRHEAADYLQSRGYPESFSTLTKRCALGEGPEPTSWWGSRPLYTQQVLDGWAERRCRRVQPRKRDLHPEIMT